MQKLINEIKSIIDSYANDLDWATDMFHDIGQLLLAHRFEQDIKHFNSITDSVDEILRLNDNLATALEQLTRAEQLGIQIAEAAISGVDADKMRLLIDKLKDI